MGGCIVYTGIRLLLLICPLFLSLQYSKIYNFRHTFLRNLVHLSTVGGCIMYTRIGLLPLICPFISSFYFLSNYQTLTFFVTFFSGTVRPRKLKLGTHVDNGCMFVYTGIRLLGLICLFICLFFFLSNFQLQICLSPLIAL